MDENLKNRLMLNGDTGTFFYSPWKWQPEGGRYQKNVIHKVIAHYAACGIDTLIMNANGQKPSYPSTRLPYDYEDYTRDDKEYIRAHWEICEGHTGETLEQIVNEQVYNNNLRLDWIEDGIDWFQEAAAACKKNGMEAWASVRMNDSHGGRLPQISYMNNHLLKAHPTYSLDKPHIDPNRTFQRYSLNYAMEEPREYMKELIADILDNYDYCGLELDFGRDPVIVAPIATDREREAITEWIREIREMTLAKAKRTNHPHHFGIKCSIQTNMLYDFGLDVDQIVAEGLLDFISLSNTYQTLWDSPIEEQKKKFGDKVAVYGYIEGAVNWFSIKADEVRYPKRKDVVKRGRDMTYSAEMMRGNAAGKLVLGADGLIFYNNFFSWDKNSTEHSSEWAILNLQNLESLRGVEKAYSFSTSFPHPIGAVALEHPLALPELFLPSASRSYKLPMIAEPNNKNLTLRVQLVFEHKKGNPLPHFAVSCNGHWPNGAYELSDYTLFPAGDFNQLLPQQVGLVYSFAVTEVLDGWNEFIVINLASEEGSQFSSLAATHCLLNIDIGIMEA